MIIEFLYAAITLLSDPFNIFVIVLGTVVGLIAGVIPGLGGVVALSLLIPITYSMGPVTALAFLAAAKGGTTFGGSITAILLNIPGSAVNTPTLLDGPKMAEKGEAGAAIGVSAMSSAAGALFGFVVLLLLLPQLTSLMIRFGSPEYFVLAIAGLLVISVAVRGSALSGLVGAAFGLMVSFIGFNPITGGIRFTYGFQYLYDGVGIVPVIIGIFAISEAIKIMGSTDEPDANNSELTSGRIKGCLQVFDHKLVFLQSSVIGLVIGAIPAIGGLTAGFISYFQARNISKYPDRFGTGWVEGVIASEAANDSKDAGDLIPTLGLGIPGSPSAAILLGAFILHGLQPGPRFLVDHIDVAFAIFLALIISNVLTSVIGLATASYLIKLANINKASIVAGIMCLSLPATYATSNNLTDVAAALTFGVIGYLFIITNISRIAFIIAFILGPIAERAFHQSLQASNGDLSIFVTRPLSAFLILITVLFFTLPWAVRKLDIDVNPLS